VSQSGQKLHSTVSGESIQLLKAFKADFFSHDISAELDPDWAKTLADKSNSLKIKYIFCSIVR
jgi:hypothetical protein